MFPIYSSIRTLWRSDAICLRKFRLTYVQITGWQEAITWTSINLPLMRPVGIKLREICSRYHSLQCVWKFHIWQYRYLFQRPVSWYGARNLWHGRKCPLLITLPPRDMVLPYALMHLFQCRRFSLATFPETIRLHKGLIFVHTRGSYSWNTVANSANIHTVKPVYNDHLMGYFSASWSSSRWPRATEIVYTSKLVPSVIIKTHYWINHR